MISIIPFFLIINGFYYTENIIWYIKNIEKFRKVIWEILI